MIETADDKDQDPENEGPKRKDQLLVLTFTFDCFVYSTRVWLFILSGGATL